MTKRRYGGTLQDYVRQQRNAQAEIAALYQDAKALGCAIVDDEIQCTEEQGKELLARWRSRNQNIAQTWAQACAPAPDLRAENGVQRSDTTDKS